LFPRSGFAPATTRRYQLTYHRQCAHRAWKEEHLVE
jgi:hypothetical protein